MSCSFCKKSASKLVTHSLCGCCLVHLESCAATAEKSIPVVWEEDAARKVECDICLEEYQENELQQHRETCMPRLVFRCSLCDEDYMSEESVWNHLIEHQIAHEDKELYYREKRVTYKQHKCILCNDQRSYRESSYWQHVHEEHDGYYLRCSECGESFPSKKRMAEHGLNHCKSREQTLTSESGGLEMGDDYANTNINEHSSQEKSNEASEKDFETNQGDQQSSLEIEVVESYGQNSTLVENCDDGLTDCNQIGDDVDEDESKGHASEEILQPPVENCSSRPSDAQCPQCNKECSNARALSRHIKSTHQPTTCDVCGLFFSSGNQANYHRIRNHSKKNYQCSICFNTFRSKDSLGKHVRGFHFHRQIVAQTGSSDSVKKQEPNKAKILWSVKTDCPICRKKFSDQSQVSQHVEEMHKVTICTICREIFTNADELSNHKCSMCPHCSKGCYNRTRLITHIELCHEMITCDVCGVSVSGRSKIWHHKMKMHSAPKLKCSQCSKKFHFKCDYKRHLSLCVKNEYKCKLCDCKLNSFTFVATHMRIVHGVTRPQEALANRNDKKSHDILDVKETSMLKSVDRMPHDQSERSFTIEGDDKDDTPKDVAKANNSMSSQVKEFKGKNRRVKVAAKVSQVLGGTTSSAKKFHNEGAYQHHLSRHNKIRNVFPCKLCGRKFKRLAYVRKHIKQVHSVRKTQTNIATSKELNQELDLKTEISVEETHLQQNESQVRNDDIEKFISKHTVSNSSQTNTATNKEMNQMEISVEDTHLQQNESQFLNDDIEKFLSKHTITNTATNQELELKMEISVEETHLQQNESQVLNDDIEKFISKHTVSNASQTNTATNKELNQELDLKMEISVEETQLQHTPAVVNSSFLEKCPHCDKNFKYTSLSRHINDNHKMRLCDFCRVSFSSKRQLNYHVMICHTDPKHKCPHCPQTFHVKSTYLRHVVTHKK